MESLENLEVYGKYIIGIIGVVVTFNKLRESFATIKHKQELKLDLEIYEKIKNNPEFDSKEFESRLNKKLQANISGSGVNLFNFFYGLILFGGFGYWTISLFLQDSNFSIPNIDVKANFVAEKCRQKSIT